MRARFFPLVFLVNLNMRPCVIYTELSFSLFGFLLLVLEHIRLLRSGNGLSLTVSDTLDIISYYIT